MKVIPQHTLDFMDSWLQFRYLKEDIPGFTVAIAHKGKVIFNKSYGYANLEEKERLTPAHIFRIASHSKTFTATAVMQLAEAGKLKIDDYIVDYLPWLKDHKDKRWQQVTIRQLLSHSAGVIRDGLDSDFWGLRRTFPNAKMLKNEILAADLILEPNVRMKYSNIGYSILGFLIEAVSGVSYHSYVTDTIVKPLGLKDTGPEPDELAMKSLAVGYSRISTAKVRQPLPHINTGALAPATGFYSTAEDLCRYFTAHMIGSGELLSDVSKREMQRIQWNVPHSENNVSYGLGFEVEQVGDHRMIGHGGGFPGYLTSSAFDPEDGLVVVVLANSLGLRVGAIKKGIISVLDYLGGDEPKESLLKYEGRFTDLWSTSQIVVKGDTIVSIYPDGWWPFYTTEELQYVDDETLKIHGASGFDSEGEYVRFTFNTSGKIESLRYAGSYLTVSEDGDYSLVTYDE